MKRVALTVFLLAIMAFARRHSRPTPMPASFIDTFQNLNNWYVSNWGPTEGSGNGNTSYFDPSQVQITPQGLALSLTQTLNPDGSITSFGGEVQSTQLFGYGTYTWTMQAASPAVSGQVSAGFSFVNNSQTEIDFEIQGQDSNTVWMTSWAGLSQTDSSGYTLLYPEQAFHTYQFVWSASSIEFYIDGVLAGTETAVVPSAPAYVMMNLWGTNSADWGGLATTGVTRVMYVSKFQYVGQ